MGENPSREKKHFRAIKGGRKWNGRFGAKRYRSPSSLAFDHREFPKNSINIDKFTGFFDKFLKIDFPGIRRLGIATQGILPRAASCAMTANAGRCAFRAKSASPASWAPTSRASHRRRISRKRSRAAKFFGNGAGATDHPGSVAGTFGANSADGLMSFIGAFGAHKQ